MPSLGAAQLEQPAGVLGRATFNGTQTPKMGVFKAFAL